MARCGPTRPPRRVVYRQPASVDDVGVGASKLVCEAGVATATCVVVTAKRQANESVRGERLDLALVP